MGKHTNRLNSYIYYVQDHSFKRNASGDVGEAQAWEKAGDRPVQYTHARTHPHTHTHTHLLRFLAAAIPRLLLLAFYGYCKKRPQIGSLTQQVFSLSQSQWLEVQNQGVGRAGSPCWALESVSSTCLSVSGGRGRDKQSLASLSLQMHLSYLPPSRGCDP